MKATGIYVLQALSGAAALAAACASLAGADLMVQQFDAMGLGPSFRLVAGSIELVAGLTLIFPRAGALGAVILVCLMVATAGATLGHLAMLRPVTERASLPVSHTYWDLIAGEHGAAKLPRKAGMREI
jgi:tetrahydromethanopterin S-methyltransferase subunit C